MADKELILSDHFLARVKEFRTEIESFEERMRKRYKAISNEITPERDGVGKKIIDQRDGYDYIIEAYMRDKLDEYFPGWSWEGMPVATIGVEAILGQGHLQVLDRDLLELSLLTSGAVSPYRRFHGAGAGRIQFKKDRPHTADNVIDIDKNMKTANSSAFKVAINRLCRIGDDVYRKRLDEEGAGTFEEVTEAQVELGGTKAMRAFTNYLAEKKIMPSKACAILGIRQLTEITDVAEAFVKIKEYVEG